MNCPYGEMLVSSHFCVSPTSFYFMVFSAIADLVGDVNETPIQG